MSEPARKRSRRLQDKHERQQQEEEAARATAELQRAKRVEQARARQAEWRKKRAERERRLNPAHVLDVPLPNETNTQEARISILFPFTLFEQVSSRGGVLAGSHWRQQSMATRYAEEWVTYATFRGATWTRDVTTLFVRVYAPQDSGHWPVKGWSKSQAQSLLEHILIAFLQHHPEHSGGMVPCLSATIKWAHERGSPFSLLPGQLSTTSLYEFVCQWMRYHSIFSRPQSLRDSELASVTAYLLASLPTQCQLSLLAAVQREAMATPRDTASVEYFYSACLSLLDAPAFGKAPVVTDLVPPFTNGLATPELIHDLVVTGLSPQAIAHAGGVDMPLKHNAVFFTALLKLPFGTAMGRKMISNLLLRHGTPEQGASSKDGPTSVVTTILSHIYKDPETPITCFRDTIVPVLGALETQSAEWRLYCCQVSAHTLDIRPDIFFVQPKQGRQPLHSSMSTGISVDPPLFNAYPDFEDISTVLAKWFDRALTNGSGNDCWKYLVPYFHKPHSSPHDVKLLDSMSNAINTHRSKGEHLPHLARCVIGLLRRQGASLDSEPTLIKATLLHVIPLLTSHASDQMILSHLLRAAISNQIFITSFEEPDTRARLASQLLCCHRRNASNFSLQHAILEYLQPVTLEECSHKTAIVTEALNALLSPSPGLTAAALSLLSGYWRSSPNSMADASELWRVCVTPCIIAENDVSAMNYITSSTIDSVCRAVVECIRAHGAYDREPGEIFVRLIQGAADRRYSVMTYRLVSSIYATYPSPSIRAIATRLSNVTTSEAGLQVVRERTRLEHVAMNSA